MPTQQLFGKVIDLSRSLLHIPDAKNRHFSFITLRNRIVSMGWNDGYKTHPRARLLGYRFDTAHSELNAFLNYRGDLDLLKKCSLVNVRVNRFKDVRIARPCVHCEKWISGLGFNEIWYTNEVGVFEKL